MRLYIGLAVVLTVVIWLIAGVNVLGLLIGDCLPGPGQRCPTDRDIVATLLQIAIAAIGSNAAAIWFLVLVYRQENP